MTESIQILLCPHCGATDVQGNVDLLTTQIHSCDSCKYDVIVADFNAIEARVLAWLVGNETEAETAVVNAFRKGFNCAMEMRVPDGYQLVPVKPTSKMVNATFPLILRSPETIYAAMLEAAPVCDLGDIHAA